MHKNISLFLSDSTDNQLLEKLFKNNEYFTVVNLDEVTDQKVTVVVNSPLTDLSILLMKKPQLKNQIEEILLIGGTDKYGDATPVAEKNIYADANAAQYVFLCGIPVVMFGLNVTRNLENRALASIIYLLDPTLFKKEECGIYVETKGTVTKGMTVTDIYSDKQFEDHHCQIILDINVDVYKLLEKSLISALRN